MNKCLPPHGCMVIERGREQESRGRRELPLQQDWDVIVVVRVRAFQDPSSPLGQQIVRPAWMPDGAQLSCTDQAVNNCHTHHDEETRLLHLHELLPELVPSPHRKSGRSQASPTLGSPTVPSLQARNTAQNNSRHQGETLQLWATVKVFWAGIHEQAGNQGHRSSDYSNLFITGF